MISSNISGPCKKETMLNNAFFSLTQRKLNFFRESFLLSKYILLLRFRYRYHQVIALKIK